MDERIEKLKELLKNEEVADKVLAPTLEETQANLKAEGIDFSMEELKDLVRGLQDAQNDSEEIDEESLKQVSGGSWYTRNCYKAGKVVGQTFRRAVIWAVTKKLF